MTALNLADLTPWYLTREERGLPPADFAKPEVEACQDCGIPFVRRNEADPWSCGVCHTRHQLRYQASKARAESVGTTLAFGRWTRHPQAASINAPRNWA